MPITITQGPAIPNRYAHINQGIKDASREAVQNLDYADIFRNPISGIAQDAAHVMRVDVQGDITNPLPIRKNLQVQVNNVHGHTTVAHVNVSTSVATSNERNQIGVRSKVITAFYRSIDTGCSFEVAGSI